MVSIKRIKVLCSPLVRLKPFIKAIWIYGSATKKKAFKPSSDIDIMILVDDTRRIDEKFLPLLEELTTDIAERARKYNLKLHFQPPKFLTLWWDLIRKGEPWAITSLRDFTIIYDPSDYIKLLSSLLKKGELYNVPEKSERLLERARQRIGEIRQISLFKIPSEILQAMTEAAQISLMQLGVFPPAPKDVSRELRRHFEKRLSEKSLEYYDEIYMIVRKINRGHMTELAGKEIDMMLKKAFYFIKEMESLLLELESRRKRYEILNAYKECILLCDKALKKRTRLPSKEELKLEYMKKYYVDKGLLSQEHYSTLRNLCTYAKAKEEEQKKLEAFLPLIRLKSLKLALSELK